MPQSKNDVWVGLFVLIGALAHLTGEDVTVVICGGPSGSGLDPHISPESARWQAGRIAIIPWSG